MVGKIRYMIINGNVRLSPLPVDGGGGGGGGVVVITVNKNNKNCLHYYCFTFTANIYMLIVFIYRKCYITRIS